MLINCFQCFLFHSIFKSKKNHLHVLLKNLQDQDFPCHLELGTLAHNPLLKKWDRKEGKGGTKEGRKQKEGRKAEKGRKGEKETERERKGQSMDRSSQGGSFSISLAEATQYLLQEGKKVMSFSRVFRSISVCFIWYLILASLVLRPDSICRGPDSLPGQVLNSGVGSQCC